VALIIKTVVVSDFQQNARILFNTNEKLAMIVDPGADVLQLFDALGDYECSYVFLTHCHLDHAGGVQSLLDLFRLKHKAVPPLLYHSKDEFLAQHIKDSAKNYGLSGYDNCPQADIYLDTMTSFSLGDCQFRLLFTPGHAPGHVALYYEKDDFTLTGHFSESYEAKSVVLAGDALFRESIGRTDLPFGDHQQLINSIQTQLFTLPDNTVVCSGHGPNTTIGHEKRYNRFF
jgi:glyoxylase-like metal-dependent hydrolase (beta-lactamase superfamily II)